MTVEQICRNVIEYNKRLRALLDIERKTSLELKRQRMAERVRILESERN